MYFCFWRSKGSTFFTRTDDGFVLATSGNNNILLGKQEVANFLNLAVNVYINQSDTINTLVDTAGPA